MSHILPHLKVGFMIANLGSTHRDLTPFPKNKKKNFYVDKDIYFAPKICFNHLIFSPSSIRLSHSEIVSYKNLCLYLHKVVSYKKNAHDPLFDPSHP